MIVTLDANNNGQNSEDPKLKNLLNIFLLFNVDPNFLPKNLCRNHHQRKNSL